MFQSLRSGKINKKDKKDKVTLTSFPEPNAHDTFINMQRQHGANVYEEQQVLSALKKKYGVTIYKDDSLIDLDENNAGNQKNNNNDDAKIAGITPEIFIFIGK